MYVTIMYLGLFVRLLLVGLVPVFGTWPGFCEPIPHAGLLCPALMQEVELNPLSN